MHSRQSQENSSIPGRGAQVIKVLVRGGSKRRKGQKVGVGRLSFELQSFLTQPWSLNG